MERLTSEQRGVVGEFFANLAVAWLAAGIIAPLAAGRNITEIVSPVSLMSVGWAVFSAGLATSLVKGG